MGREGHETTVVCSSIALLQERFRQLERVKEKREERELLRTISEPNNNKECFNVATNNEPLRLFFHPDLIFPSRRSSTTSSHQQVSLSLWPTFEANFEDQYYYCADHETPHQVFVKLWDLDTSNVSPFEASFKLGFGDSHETDVDTSLHL